MPERIEVDLDNLGGQMRTSHVWTLSYGRPKDGRMASDGTAEGPLRPATDVVLASGAPVNGSGC